MRPRILSLLVLCGALLAPLEAHADIRSSRRHQDALAIRDGVMLHSRPSSQAPVLATLVQQTEVEVVGGRDRWAHVAIWDSVRGWIAKRDLTSRRPWPTVSTYRAPEIHDRPRPHGPEQITADATVTTTMPLYRLPGGNIVGHLTAGSHATIAAWRQDRAGMIWYQIGGSWISGDGISFASHQVTQQGRNEPIWGPVARKGMWLTLGSLTGTQPSILVAAAVRDGVTHLFVEAAISPLGFHGKNAVGKLIEAAHRQRVAVIAWVYPYLQDIASDIELTREVAAFRTPSGQRFDGIAADLERTIRLSTVRAYSQLVRAYLGDRYLLVGVTYPPQSFPNYPYAEVGRRYNVIAPMDYWHQTATSYGLDYGHMRYGQQYGYSYAVQSIRAIRRVVGNIPVAPIGQTFDNYGRLEMGPHAPSASEVQGFLSGCRQAGAVGASFFQWSSATSAEWRAIHNFRF